MVYTRYCDNQGNKIYLRSLLKSSSGNLYLVEYDLKLSYVLFDIVSGTIEKLVEDVAKQLKVLAEDTAQIVNQL